MPWQLFSQCYFANSCFQRTAVKQLSTEALAALLYLANSCYQRTAVNWSRGSFYCCFSFNSFTAWLTVNRFIFIYWRTHVVCTLYSLIHNSSAHVHSKTVENYDTSCRSTISFTRAFFPTLFAISWIIIGTISWIKYHT